jgi:hypothetical protein
MFQPNRWLPLRAWDRSQLGYRGNSPSLVPVARPRRGLLVYAACHSEAREPALVIGLVEEALFATLIFASPLRKHAVMELAAGGDTIMALFFLALLASPQTL